MSVWDEEGVKKLYPLKVEVTDDVPDDAALEKPDGSVNAYDETGEKVGEVSAEEIERNNGRNHSKEDVEAAAAATERKKEYMERSAECLKEDFAFAEDLRLKTMRFVA